MRIILSALLIMTGFNCVTGQETYSWQDSVSEVDTDKIVLSDTIGDTSLSRGIARCVLPISLVNNPIFVDGFTIKLESHYTPEGAKKSISTGKPQILYHGGFGGMPDLDTKEAKHFRKKYGIDLYSQGCIRMSDDDEEGYNRIIFQYLDRKFGKAWRYELPDGAIGFEPPVKEYTAARVTCYVNIPNSEIDTDGKKKLNERIKSNYGQWWLILFSVTMAAGSLAFIWYR